MGIGEGWIYSKSFLCTKQAAFCSLFMPVIIKICVFAFVYSASLVETTCWLFPIFRWSGVPTRVPARNIEIDLFSSADNQPTLIATALWIYYLVFTHGNTKIYQIDQDPGDSSILGLFSIMGLAKLSSLTTFFLALMLCVSQSTLVDWPGCTFHSTPKKVEKCISWTNIRFFGSAQT